MKLKNLIAKAVRGETLNALELAELEKFDPDALETDLAAARTRLDEAETAKLSDEEKLRRELEQAVAERDDARRQHGELLRKQSVEELARQSGCSEPGYLDYLARRDGVDLADAAQSAKFIEKLRAASPHCFVSRLKPGSGGAEPPADSPGGPVPARHPGGGDRIDGLIRCLSEAPELAR